MKITIEDIAREAGVSKMTVSRVLNNSPFVKSLTRNKIQKIIKKKGYSINLFAKMLSQGNPLNMVCLIVSVENFFGKYYFLELLNTLEQMLEKEKYSLFIFNLIDKDKKVIKNKLDIIVNFYQGKVISNVILIGPPGDDGRMDYLNKKGVKGILIGSIWEGKNFGYIDVDNREGIRLAMEYLIQQGHKKIAFIKGPDYLSSSLERLEGFVKAAAEHKIRIPAEYIIDGGYTKEGGWKAANKLFQLPHLPTAVLAANDDMAVGLYESAQMHHLKIPDDVSVIGFDNINYSEMMVPALTTVAQPLQEIAKKASEALLKHDFKIRERVSPHLIKRGSVQRIKAE